MRLSDLLKEDAFDEIKNRLRVLDKSDVIPLFNPSLRDLDNEKHRAFMSPTGQLIVAWPTSSGLLHAHMGDYHNGTMKTLSPMARNIYNCVILWPPAPRFNRPDWSISNANLADDRPMSFSDYLKKYTDRMTKYSGTDMVAEGLEDPDFLQWFQGSKIVDPKGQPLVVYHGTNREFDGFDPNAAPINRISTQDGRLLDRPGIYWTSHQPSAASYAVAAKRREAGGRARVVTAYLRMRNPLDITNTIKNGQRRGLTFGDAKRAALSKLDPDVHDGYVFKGNGQNHPEYMVFDDDQVWKIK